MISKKEKELLSFGTLLIIIKESGSQVDLILFSLSLLLWEYSGLDEVGSRDCKVRVAQMNKLFSKCG